MGLMHFRMRVPEDFVWFIEEINTMRSSLSNADVALPPTKMRKV
jgi:hypothetical protein